MPISHYEITLVSPSFPEAPLYKWYLVRIYIYTDESKSVLLGNICYDFYSLNLSHLFLCYFGSVD